MEKLISYSNLILRLILACTFAYAAISKIIFPDEFFYSIRNYQITPDILSYIIAYFLPALEISSACLILMNKFFKVSIFCITSMLIIFIIAILSAWTRGLDINCGCFGYGSSEGYEMVIFRDLILIVFCVILILINKKKLSKYT